MGKFKIPTVSSTTNKTVRFPNNKIDRVDPKGDENDKTMLPDYYDGVYNYLKEIGIEEI